SRRVLEDAAPPAPFPGIERFDLVRARGPPSRAAGYGRPARGMLEVEPGLAPDFPPAARVRGRHDRPAGGLGQGPDGHARPFVAPVFREVVGLVDDAVRLAFVAPAGEHVDRFEIAVAREAGPGFVHRSLERQAVAVRISQ